MPSSDAGPPNFGHLPSPKHQNTVAQGRPAGPKHQNTKHRAGQPAQNTKTPNTKKRSKHRPGQIIAIAIFVHDFVLHLLSETA